MKYNIIPYGQDAFLINFENEIKLSIHQDVRLLYEALRKFPEKGIQALTPGYCSITVYVQKELINLGLLYQLCEQAFQNYDLSKLKSFKVELPVCYEEEFGVDLSRLEKETELTQDEIIKLHSKTEYLVYMKGFVPGFLYLGGLLPELHCPRLIEPRLKIPQGAVAIGGNQTGIYPIESPGGWQIIGNCPLDLVGNDESEIIEMGDIVQFKSISSKEHNELIGHAPKRILIHEN